MFKTDQNTDNFTIAVMNFFKLLVAADGDISEKEIRYGERMAEMEGFPVESIHEVVANNAKNSDSLLKDGLRAIRQLTSERQIRIIAWLCAIANADGFMHSGEWKTIYQIYHKELNLNKDLILAEQKNIQFQLIRSQLQN